MLDSQTSQVGALNLPGLRKRSLEFESVPSLTSYTTLNKLSTVLLSVKKCEQQYHLHNALVRIQPVSQFSHSVVSDFATP